MSEAKNKRRVAEGVATMQRRVTRLLSLSVAVVRAEILFNSFANARRSYLESGLTDALALDENLRATQELRPTDFAAADTYLGFFLATLYEITVKWDRWEFTDETVDQLRADEIMSELRKFRQGVFHVTEFNDKDLVAFAENPRALQWSIDLLAALKSALTEWHDQTEPKIREELNQKGWS